jgi:hypothetical protein
MNENSVSKIEAAMTEADGILRRQLASGGLENTGHIMLAVAPDGAAVIRSNCEPDALRAMAAFLVDIADQIEAEGEGKAP